MGVFDSDMLRNFTTLTKHRLDRFSRTNADFFSAALNKIRCKSRATILLRNTRFSYQFPAGKALIFDQKFDQNKKNKKQNVYVNLLIKRPISKVF